MKILTISAQKPNSTGSGVYLMELVKSFCKKGFQNVIVCGIDKDDILEEEEGIIYEPVYFQTKDLPFPVVGMSDLMPYKSTRYRDLTPDMQKQFEDKFINKIKSVEKKFHPDLILCHHLYFLTALVREYFPDQKIAAICHNTDLRQFKNIEMQNDRIQKNIQSLDLIFSLHDKQKDEIASLFKIDKKKIRTIGAGYNNRVFQNKKLERPKDKVHIVYAGKLSDQKGVPCLLSALNKICVDKKIKLSLAGGYSDENEYRKIKKAAEESRYEIEFLGKLSQKELAEVFNQSHIFVLPSFSEGLPLVVVEALACGLKVIVTDLPGLKDWMDDHIKDHNISFVKLSRKDKNALLSVEEIEQFTDNLSKEIEKAIMQYKTYQMPDVSGVSWDSVADQILKSERKRR